MFLDPEKHVLHIRNIETGKTYHIPIAELPDKFAGGGIQVREVVAEVEPVEQPAPEPERPITVEQPITPLIDEDARLAILALAQIMRGEAEGGDTLWHGGSEPFTYRDQVMDADDFLRAFLAS